MPGVCYFCGDEAIKFREDDDGSVVPEDGWEGRSMFVGSPSSKVTVCRECFHHPRHRKASDEKSSGGRSVR